MTLRAACGGRRCSVGDLTLWTDLPAKLLTLAPAPRFEGLICRRDRHHRLGNSKRCAIAYKPLIVIS